MAGEIGIFDFGIMQEYGGLVERVYREVKVMAIGGGAEEIMRGWRCAGWVHDGAVPANPPQKARGETTGDRFGGPRGFMRHGFDGAKIARIAKLAGVVEGRRNDRLLFRRPTRG